jgi:hypothetical protein
MVSCGSRALSTATVVSHQHKPSILRKVYLPNLAEGVTIQGMDALLGNFSGRIELYKRCNKVNLWRAALRVSRNLRKLVQDLPDTPEKE